MSRPSWQSIGEAGFARCERVSSELLALTGRQSITAADQVLGRMACCSYDRYGSFVRQLLVDYEDPLEVNNQLETMGYNIGVRLVDDFFAKSKINNCSSFNETAEVIAKVAFKMFLGVTALVGVWSGDKKTFGLTFDENPLAEFAELPESCSTLWYSNVLCGVIRGALEMVNMKVECKFVRCRLRGDDTNEIRVSLNEILSEKPPINDD